MINLELSFRTPEQKLYFESRKRFAAFSGGFGNGKTFMGCKHAITLMASFPNYRVAIARFEESKLRQTTMKTFFKPNCCDPGLYDTNYGGNRADSLNKCKFINGSEILWMNLKDTDDGVIRGLEINLVLIDQAEEISESQYLLLAARVGRWDQAEVPPNLLAQREDWPLDNRTHKPRVPNYMRVLCNPDSELHWIYKRYHPDSPEWREKYYVNHEMIQSETTSATIDEELLESMKENEPEWVDRFVKGKWGIPGGQIHRVADESILNPDDPDVKKFLEKALDRGYLYRAMDHGDSAPTCVLWFCAYGPYHICYREYYQPDKLVSYHRQAIADISGNERYSASWADPDIFRSKSQKGQRWSIAEEYVDKQIKAPPISWAPASNEEFACRSAVAELLKRDINTAHPITGIINMPRMYFIDKTEDYPNGCSQSYRQTRSQKRKKVGSVDGKDLFSDERAEGVADHAYDPIRYYAVQKAAAPSVRKPNVRPGSFYDVRRIMQHRNKKYRVLN